MCVSVALNITEALTIEVVPTPDSASLNRSRFDSWLRQYFLQHYEFILINLKEMIKITENWGVRSDLESMLPKDRDLTSLS